MAQEIPYEFLQAGGYVGPSFMSVFFFEEIFWRVAIPLGYGSFQINVLESLPVMPIQFKERLVHDPISADAYKRHWADCQDYAVGRSTTELQFASSAAGEFFAALDRDLSSAVADLSQKKPNSNALQHSRLATEKSMKAFLCARHGFTVETLRKQFGHDIDKLAAEVESRAPGSELATIKARTFVLGEYSDRYSSKTHSRGELWSAYRCAQSAASALVRCLNPSYKRVTF